MKEKYPWQQKQDERREERRGPKYLKHKAKKLETEDKIYAVLRKDFLLDHPVCQCGTSGCTSIATEVHHKKGRGRFFLEVETFLAVCRACHNFIENHPVWAKQHGYSENRLTK